MEPSTLPIPILSDSWQPKAERISTPFIKIHSLPVMTDLESLPEKKSHHKFRP